MKVMFILSHLMLIQIVWKTNLLELPHAPRYSNMTTMQSALEMNEKNKSWWDNFLHTNLPLMVFKLSIEQEWYQ